MEPSTTRGRSRSELDSGTARLLRLYAALFVLAVVAAAFGMRFVVRSADEDVPGLPGARPLPAAARTPDPGIPVIAGTGAALPLLEALAAAHGAAGGGTVRIPASIGSSGGLLALADGAVDAAIVSRDVRPEERPPGTVVVPFCEAPVGLAAGRGAPDRTLRREDVLDLYAGRRTLWSDGRPAIVVLRERGDSGTAAFARTLPGFAEVHEAAAAAGTWRVVSSDGAMMQALAELPGAIGVVDLGTLRVEGLPLRPLAVAPDVPGREVDAKPPTRTFALVIPARPPRALAAFVDFVCGPGGRAVLGGYGYVALPCGGRDGR